MLFNKRRKLIALCSTWALILKRRQKSLILSHSGVQKEYISEVKCKLSKENSSVLVKHSS